MCHVLENLSDPAWHSLLRHLLIEYVTLLTNPEGPAPSAPSLTRQEVLGSDAARQEARAAAAAAVDGGSGGGDGGDSGGGGGGGGDEGEGQGGRPGKKQKK